MTTKRSRIGVRIDKITSVCFMQKNIYHDVTNLLLIYYLTLWFCDPYLNPIIVAIVSRVCFVKHSFRESATYNNAFRILGKNLQDDETTFRFSMRVAATFPNVVRFAKTIVSSRKLCLFIDLELLRPKSTEHFLRNSNADSSNYTII